MPNYELVGTTSMYHSSRPGSAANKAMNRNRRRTYVHLRATGGSKVVVYQKIRLRYVKPPADLPDSQRERLVLKRGKHRGKIRAAPKKKKLGWYDLKDASRGTYGGRRIQ